MEKVLHAQNAVLAKKLVAAALSQHKNYTPAKAVEFAAHEALTVSATMSAQAFIEGAEDCGVSSDVARSSWHRGYKGWFSAPSFGY